MAAISSQTRCIKSRYICMALHHVLPKALGFTITTPHRFNKVNFPDGKIHQANMGPTLVLSAPGGPHVGPMNLAVRACWWNTMDVPLKHGSLGDKSLDKWFPHTEDSNALKWHHNERDGVSCHQPHDCLLNRLFRHKWKKTSKLRFTGLCAGKSQVTGEFPAQKASYAENVSTWWRHHGQAFSILCLCELNRTVK